MATLKFKSASPYTKPKSSAPEEDYLYKQYESDFNLDLSKKKNGKHTRVALFGIGRAGTIHLINLIKNPRVQILYIIDDLISKWEKLRAYWNLTDVEFLTSKDAIKVYDDPRVDAVVVSSPTYTHESIVTKSLAAKKAVFCEKPIADDIEITAKCYKQADLVKKPLFCAFNRRFDPSFSTVWKRMRSGEIGHANIVKVCSRDSPLPTIDYLRTSNGIFHDCVIHDLDMATWVVGELPCKIQATATSNVPEIKDINDYDTVACVLTFPSGTIALTDNSRISSYGYDQRLEVFGDKGMLRAENERPVHSVDSHVGLGNASIPPIWFSFPSRYRLAYHLEMEHFLDVIEGRSELQVHGYQTIAVSKIATAAEKSARTGETVLLEWTDEEDIKPYS